MYVCMYIILHGFLLYNTHSGVMTNFILLYICVCILIGLYYVVVLLTRHMDSGN